MPQGRTRIKRHTNRSNAARAELKAERQHNIGTTGVERRRMSDKWMEDFSKTGLFNLTRRHLTLIHLLWNYCKRESARVAGLEAPYEKKMWFVKIPTVATFFSKRGDGKIISVFN